MAVPLLYATLPGGPARTLATGIGRLQSVRSEFGAVRTLKSAFTRAQATELNGIGQSYEGAVADLTRAMEAFPEDSSLTGNDVTALRAAVAIYSQTFPSMDESVTRVRETAALDAFDMLLGSLSTRDEAWLREPVRDMRLAELAFASWHDPHSLDQRALWGDLFSQRLAAMMLATETRVRLAEAIANYWRGMPPELVSIGADKHRETELAVALAITARQSALNWEEIRLSNENHAMPYQLYWLVGTCLVISALAISAGVSALWRLLFVRRMDQSWSSR